MEIADSYDVVIVGGAAMGSATAYSLAANPDFDGSVLVVERDPTYETCATTRSWGGVRQQFSTPANIKMSLYGARFIKQVGDFLSLEGEAPDLSFRENGYLFMASESGLPVLKKNIELQQSLGADITLIAPDEIARRFPYIDTKGIAGAGFGLRNEGWLDPHSLLTALRRKAQALGTHYVNDEVVAVEQASGGVAAVKLSNGKRIACGSLVNAAGTRAGQFAGLAGVELPVVPRKRMSYIFDCREELPRGPLTIDATGVIFRNEGTYFISIVSPPQSADRDADLGDLEEDYSLFEEVIWPALAARVPAFEAIKLTGAWAGHYDYNKFDQNGILGAHPELTNLYFCNGFSGHGIQQAPAAGRAIAELIAYGAYRSLDLSELSYNRILENRPVVEANVF